MNEERQFPIHAEYSVWEFPPSIPWALIQAHEAQALANHGQSLERLKERGGLSAAEALAVLEDKAYYDRWPTGGDPITAISRLRQLVKEWAEGFRAPLQ